MYQSKTEKKKKYSRLTEQQRAYIYLTPKKRSWAQTWDLSGCNTVCLHLQCYMMQVYLVFSCFNKASPYMSTITDRKRKYIKNKVELLNNDHPPNKCATYLRRVFFDKRKVILKKGL